MAEYKVDATMVNGIGDDISRVNKDLKEILINSKQKISGLAVEWEGKAAESTIDGFCAYMDKFSDHYYTMINQFAVFLKNNIAAGAVEVENANSILE